MALDAVLASKALCRQCARRTMTVLTDFQLGHQDVFDGNAFERLGTRSDMMAVDTSNVTMLGVFEAAVSEPARWHTWRNDLKPDRRVVVGCQMAFLAGVVLGSRRFPRDGLKNGRLDQP